MSEPVAIAETQIAVIIENAFHRAVGGGELTACAPPPFKIEVPDDRAHGDYASNAAFVLAKLQRKAPRAVADILVNYISLKDSCFEHFEAAGAGFINFTLGSAYYADVLRDVMKNKDAYGRSDTGKGQSVLVEFVSANPTGPMHIGNARGGAVGDCLASLLEAAGYRTQREFYINDAGNQIEKFALSLDLRYQQLYRDGAELPEDSYHGADIVAHAEGFAALHGDAYLYKSERERRQALVAYALPKNIDAMKSGLEKYRITYDTWFKESTLHENGEVQKVLSLLEKSGCTYESEGALWFRATAFGCDKDFVLVRQNGIPTYVVPDIAYHYNKLAVRGFDRAVDVLGADHHGYVPRLKAALSALGIDGARLDVVLMQMVRLVRDGETVKASKRSGNAITLATLLDEVPIDAARFFFNYREANTHLDFDLDLAVEQSSQNPAYYCQYAHARICSIFTKLTTDGITVGEASPEELALLQTDAEKALITHIAALSGEIAEAAKQYNPARITQYAVELASRFHKFYNAQRVIGGDEGLMRARLFLCDCTRIVMKNVLTLLKIDAPEKM